MHKSTTNFVFSPRRLSIALLMLSDSKRFFCFDAKSPHVAVSAGIHQRCWPALICARSRSGARIGDRVSRISAADTRYNATRVPVHEHSRARPRDYIGVRTVGRWDERERIVVRTRRLPTELIGCSSERARRAKERDGRRAWRGYETQKRHGRSARETAGEAVER